MQILLEPFLHSLKKKTIFLSLILFYKNFRHFFKTLISTFNNFKLLLKHIDYGININHREIKIYYLK